VHNLDLFISASLGS